MHQILSKHLAVELSKPTDMAAFFLFFGDTVDGPVASFVQQSNIHRVFVEAAQLVRDNSIDLKPVWDEMVFCDIRLSTSVK